MSSLGQDLCSMWETNHYVRKRRQSQPRRVQQLYNEESDEETDESGDTVTLQPEKEDINAVTNSKFKRQLFASIEVKGHAVRFQ